MGADQNLIRAAAQMGPKPFDYSGIMKGIAAIGKYTAAKRAVVNEITTSGKKQMKDIQELSPEIFAGKYGNQNMAYLTNAKKQWTNAIDIIKKPLNLPGSKKYKDAVKTINSIKTNLEKNKASILKWTEIRSESDDLVLGMSAGTGSEAENKVLDIKLNEVTGEINSNLVFTNNGMQVVDEENNMYSIDDILSGYKRNLVSDDIRSDLQGIITKYGSTSANSNDPTFNKTKASEEIKSLFNNIKTGKDYKLGFAGIRSLAYDWNYGDGSTFIQENAKFDLQLSDEQWLKSNPNASEDEISTMKQQTMANAYGPNNQQLLETKLFDFVLKKVEDDYNNTKSNPRSSSDSKLAMALVVNKENSTMRADKVELANAVTQIKSKKSFGIDGTLFSWNSKNQQWVYQDLNADINNDGSQSLVPVPAGPQSPGTEGSAEALLFIFANNPGIAKALGLGEEKPSQGLPVYPTDTTKNI